MQRGFAIMVAVALFVSALVPMAAPLPIRAVSPDVVISQVYGGGGNAGATYTNDFIELYNLGPSTVDLSGWSVQYASATGTSWARTNLGGSIAPGQHYLIQQAAGAGGTMPLPTPDATGTIAMSATQGKVALLTNQTTLPACGSTAAPCMPNAAIRDFVGYGGASEFEGSGPAPTLSNTTAALRANGGATDTDNNAADFTAGAPDPRNSKPSQTLSGVGDADPASLPPGDSTLLTVTVTPAANPSSTAIGVTADLSQIGGSAAQPFLDDGTDGDATAGDLVFSFTATVGLATNPGTKSLLATISDAQDRTASAEITLTVQGDPVQIWEIQGEAHISPLNNEQVFGVDGIVTAVSVQGFWMTDPISDDVDATSDGIFVFRGAAGSKPPVGSWVTVDGTVSEFRPGGAGGVDNLTITQIGSATWSLVDEETHPLPVTIVGQGGRMPPTEVIDNDTNGSVEDTGSGTAFDPAEDGIDFWESLEGMYLQVNDALAVGPRNNFGEIAIVADGGANAGPFTERGGLYVAPGDFNPERLILDDVITATPFVNTGDTFTTPVTGVLDYSFGNFKLYTTTALVGVSGGIAREVTDGAGAREIAIASFNVENLSVTNPQVKFDTLAGQVVHNLRSPDLLAIQEIQDDSGSANNGVVTAAATWQRLIDAIAGAGGPIYEYRSIDPVNNDDGGAPGANIRVGFLFRTDRGLEFVDRPGGTSVNDTAAAPHPSGPRLTFSPGRIGTGDAAFNETRKSLGGEFRWRGETLFVIANHFSSKGGDDPLFGRWQPPVRYTEFYFPGGAAADTDGWRWGQAQVVNDFVDDLLALDADANVIVLGDINDFHFSDTVRILSGTATDVLERTVEPTGEAPVLTTLFDLLPPDEQYSYVFDGNSQVLDQILVSGNILDRGPVYDVVHVNAEFAVQASDHEPSVMRVSFQPKPGRR